LNVRKLEVVTFIESLKQEVSGFSSSSSKNQE